MFNDGDSCRIRGDNMARCDAIVRLPHGDFRVMFGLVKLHLSTQRSLESPDTTEDTEELSTLIEALHFFSFPQDCFGALVH